MLLNEDKTWNIPQMELSISNIQYLLIYFKYLWIDLHSVLCAKIFKQNQIKFVFLVYFLRALTISFL